MLAVCVWHVQQYQNSREYSVFMFYIKNPYICGSVKMWASGAVDHWAADSELKIWNVITGHKWRFLWVRWGGLSSVGTTEPAPLSPLSDLHISLLISSVVLRNVHGGKHRRPDVSAHCLIWRDVSQPQARWISSKNTTTLGHLTQLLASELHYRTILILQTAFFPHRRR